MLNTLALLRLENKKLLGVFYTEMGSQEVSMDIEQKEEVRDSIFFHNLCHRGKVEEVSEV